MKTETRAYVNIVALAAVLLFNYLSNALPLNNFTQQDISFDLYPVLLTPAGYVFPIWGVIYLLLIAFIVYQALPKYRGNPYNNAVGILFAVTSLLNIFWLLAWHFLQIGLSLVIMAFLLLTLMAVYLRINRQVSRGNIYDMVFVKLSFSLYLAWICVAILANLNVFLYDIGWLGVGFGSVLFTILMIIIGAVVALYIFLVRRDYVFPLVFAWAFIGIAVRHGSELVLLTIVALTSAVVLLFFVVWFFRSWGIKNSYLKIVQTYLNLIANS